VNWCLRIAFLAAIATAPFNARGYELKDGAYHAFPSDNLQAVLNLAATNKTARTIKVHAGTYLPRSPGQALIFLNRRHDGIHLLGMDRPVLTAANPALTSSSSAGYPAVVNHVIYFGDGVSSNTVVENFRLTGANHFVTNSFQAEMEPDRELPKGRFYYGDGGAIKIYRRSCPVLRDLEIVDNYASPCAGGISIQQEGENRNAVLIENCVFRNNRAEVTGAALDLLWGSSARVINCLFVGNVSNTGPGEGYNPFDNNGAVTVFPRSQARFQRCTFTGNRNGVDDMSGLGQYDQCLFYSNLLAGGTPGRARFELDLSHGGKVRHCAIMGRLQDPLGVVSATNNFLNPADLQLDDNHVPTGGDWTNVGYRPIESATAAGPE
jgi:hypothetical protein